MSAKPTIVTSRRSKRVRSIMEPRPSLVVDASIPVQRTLPLNTALPPHARPQLIAHFRRKLVIRLPEIGTLFVLQDASLLFRVTGPKREGCRRHGGDERKLPDRVQHCSS